jgi:hypothetical protein
MARCEAMHTANDQRASVAPMGPKRTAFIRRRAGGRRRQAGARRWIIIAELNRPLRRLNGQCKFQRGAVATAKPPRILLKCRTGGRERWLPAAPGGQRPDAPSPKPPLGPRGGTSAQRFPGTRQVDVQHAMANPHDGPRQVSSAPGAEAACSAAIRSTTIRRPLLQCGQHRMSMRATRHMKSCAASCARRWGAGMASSSRAGPGVAPWPPEPARRSGGCA